MRNLPLLDDAYPVTPAQHQEFQANGHILLRQLASKEEMAVYRPVIVETAEKQLTEVRPLEQRDTYGKAFLQIFHLCEQDERVRQFALARRFAKAAADLMGVPAVRFYHDQVLFKEPGGGHTPWHQDQYYIPLDTHQVVTMWIAMVDVTPEMGTMSFASGSHLQGPLLDMEISDAAHSSYGQLLEQRQWPVTNCGTMAAGDASIHYGWTVHRAEANSTATMREAMTLLYYADGARVEGPNPKIVATAGRMHLGGRLPGQCADSHRNPVVYQR